MPLFQLSDWSKLDVKKTLNRITYLKLKFTWLCKQENGKLMVVILS